jgi:glycosyltransferase involved in cell wall biosynthesis
MRKRLAIVSSYSQSCGNAAFTRVLHDAIENFADVDVEVIELDLPLLQSSERKVRRIANAEIAAMAAKLRTFDGVNIQFEASLYGTFPSDIGERVGTLIAANPNTTVTFHSPRLLAGTASEFRAAVMAVFRLQLRTAVKALLTRFRGNVHVKLNRRVMRSIVRHQARVIVHTERARRQIEALFGYRKIDVHPLKIVPADFKPDPTLIARLRQQSGIDDGDTVIGMFGYVSAYKGHLDALEAMRHLPAKFKLMIFGRQHPQSIKTDGSVDPYLKMLIGKIESTPELRGRVFFAGELGDASFLDVAGSIDVAWLPYYENGQDGSGIASICLDLCPRVLASASFAFDELFRLISYSNVTRFDIGNYLELAGKTRNVVQQPAPSRPFGDASQYSVRSQGTAYIRDLPALREAAAEAAPARHALSPVTQP